MIPPDHAALLAAIVAHPDDDLTRLVFADYLEESGHPAQVARAAYIRTHIEAHTHPHDYPRRLQLTRLAVELRAQFRDEADLILDAPKCSAIFATRQRGFVTALRATVEQLQPIAAELFRIAPITALHLESFTAPTAHWLRTATEVGPITRLKLGPSAWPIGHTFRREADRQTVPVEAEALLACRHFRQLAALDLSGNGITNAWLLWFLPRLAEAPIGQALVELDLARNDLGDHAASLLGSARITQRLTRLVVTNNRISDAALSHLRQTLGKRVVT